MSRFRYEGRAWNGKPFTVAPCLRVFGDQVTAADPLRYVVDGTVASREHDRADFAANGRYSSDHSAMKDRGTIRAIDFGGVEWELDAMIEALRLSKDERIKYVIYEGRMFSSYEKNGVDPFEWRYYGGPSPHDSHGHLSTWPWADNRIEEWVLEDEVPQFTEEEEQVLRDIVNGIANRNSTGWGFATQGVDVIRKERDYPLEEIAEASATDEVARVGVGANADEIKVIKETLRSV